VNAIWQSYWMESTLKDSLQKTPNDPEDRLESLTEAEQARAPAIQLLGIAKDYDLSHYRIGCDQPWMVNLCAMRLRTARRGQALLTKPDLVAALSPATRERLRQTLRLHEEQYSTQLDTAAASGKGNPYDFCTSTIASVPGCERAIAADRAALRDNSFPEWSCSHLWPGVVNEQSVAAQAERDAQAVKAGHPLPDIFRSPRLSLSEARRRTEVRLKEELGYLEAAKRGE
jgi:hypothetical protein